jgi:PAS domain S-box-containing protein
MDIMKLVTGLKKAQTELRCNEARLQALLDNARDGVMIVDQDGVILYAPPHAHPILGYQPEELAGRPIWGLLLDDTKAELAEIFQELLNAPGAVRHQELRVRHKDGGSRTIECAARNLLSSPDIQGIVINYHDVTARRIAEDHLIESERLYRALVETTNTGYVIVDKTGMVVDANPEYLSLAGYRGLDEIRGRNVLEWTAAHDTQRNTEALAKLAQEGLIRNLEIDYVDRHGRITPVEINATAVTMGGKPLMLAICRDITARRKAADELRRSEVMLAEAERLAGIGSFDRDLVTGKVLRSEGFFHLFGLKPQDMPDLPEAYLPYIHPDDRERSRDTLRKSIAEGTPYRDEYRIRRPDGTQCVAHVGGRIIQDETGRPVRFFGWLQDITERRELEEKVLNISDREQRRIGHDLHDDIGQRLTGITLLGRALHERLCAQSSPEAGALAELLQHVDDTLARTRDLSRGLEPAPARPEGLLEALSDLAAHVRSTSQVSCRFEADRRVLVRDPNVANHLYRIAQEAAHNAVRHGRPRQVTITLTEDDRGLNLTVADDGAGLLESPKKDAGMGLDIMRHRASLIHGTLTIASRSGKGTEVSCRVPAEASALGGGA